jgi:hypothetical protein
LNLFHQLSGNATGSGISVNGNSVSDNRTGQSLATVNKAGVSSQPSSFVGMVVTMAEGISTAKADAKNVTEPASVSTKCVSGISPFCMLINNIN